MIPNRVGLELRAVALDIRLAPQEDRLAVAYDDEGVGRVVGDAEALKFEQRVHDGIGRRERTGGAGRQSELACGRAVQASPTAVRLGPPRRLHDRRGIAPRWRRRRILRLYRPQAEYQQ